MKQGEYFLLLGEDGKRWLEKFIGAGMHTHLGEITREALERAGYGEYVESKLGRRLLILRPTLNDIVQGMGKVAQIIYPRDSSTIAAISGLRPGCRVIDAGTGSGGVAIYLASVVGPKGRIHTFEQKKEHYDVAKRNIEEFGFGKIVKIENATFEEGTKKVKGNVDLVTLDLKDPQDKVALAAGRIKVGGYLCAFSVDEETSKLVQQEMKRNGFVDVVTLVCACTEMCYAKGRMNKHTWLPAAHMTFGRKFR